MLTATRTTILPALSPAPRPIIPSPSVHELPLIRE
uniref:Uncharacterized protein n=1 Tax=Picea sitchensis TaxID=3332 RepID=A9NYV9_PICSI|nr:unknown [Picea sitchensis]